MYGPTGGASLAGAASGSLAAGLNVNTPLGSLGASGALAGAASLASSILG